MNSVKMVCRNIGNYGIINLVIMSFFEIIYCIKSNYRSQLFYDESQTSKYDQIKNKNGLRKNNTIIYDAPYSPTPIYFLYLINSALKKFNLKNSYFIDFGCGAGRTLSFFKKKFIKLIGIDLNANYKKFITNDIFINLNLRNQNAINTVIKKFSSQKYVLYFYEPFDQKLVLKIIKKFKNKKLIIILINVDKLNVKYLNLKFEKKFNNNVKNIRIYSNNYLD